MLRFLFNILTYLDILAYLSQIWSREPLVSWHQENKRILRFLVDFLNSWSFQHISLRHGPQDPYYPEMRTIQGSWSSWLTSWTPGYFHTSLSDMVLRILIVLRSGHFKDAEVPGWHPELLVILTHLSQIWPWGSLLSWDQDISRILRFLADILNSWVF